MIYSKDIDKQSKKISAKNRTAMYLVKAAAALVIVAVVFMLIYTNFVKADEFAQSGYNIITFLKNETAADESEKVVVAPQDDETMAYMLYIAGAVVVVVLLLILPRRKVKKPQAITRPNNVKRV